VSPTIESGREQTAPNCADAHVKVSSPKLQNGECDRALSNLRSKACTLLNAFIANTIQRNG
jgi:hypothetical protein